MLFATSQWLANRQNKDRTPTWIRSELCYGLAVSFHQLFKRVVIQNEDARSIVVLIYEEPNCFKILPYRIKRSTSKIKEFTFYLDNQSVEVAFSWHMKHKVRVLSITLFKVLMTSFIYLTIK